MHYIYLEKMYMISDDLLDLKMPKMNGLELSEDLQNIDPNLFL